MDAFRFHIKPTLSQKVHALFLSLPPSLLALRTIKESWFITLTTHGVRMQMFRQARVQLNPRLEPCLVGGKQTLVNLKAFLHTSTMVNWH